MLPQYTAIFFKKELSHGKFVKLSLAKTTSAELLFDNSPAVVLPLQGSDNCMSGHLVAPNK